VIISLDVIVNWPIRLIEAGDFLGTGMIGPVQMFCIILFSWSYDFLTESCWSVQAENFQRETSCFKIRKNKKIPKKKVFF